MSNSAHSKVKLRPARLLMGLMATAMVLGTQNSIGQVSRPKSAPSDRTRPADMAPSTNKTNAQLNEGLPPPSGSAVLPVQDAEERSWYLSNWVGAILFVLSCYLVGSYVAHRFRHRRDRERRTKLKSGNDLQVVRTTSIDQRLTTLAELKVQGLIDDEEYKVRRQRIIDEI